LAKLAISDRKRCVLLPDVVFLREVVVPEVDVDVDLDSELDLEVEVEGLVEVDLPEVEPLLGAVLTLEPPLVLVELL